MSCTECGLYRNCLSPKFKPLVSPPVEGIKPVLVVGSYPAYREDQDNQLLIGSSELVKDFLDGMTEEGVPWVYTTALRCHPGVDSMGKFQTPTEDQVAHCQEFLLPVLQEHSPSCIIWLGTQAMQSFFGEDCPKSITEARKLGIVYLDDIPVMGSYSPSAHNARKLDLIPEYANIFTRAIRIAKGEWKEPDFEYQVIRSPLEPLPDLSDIDGPVFMDLEVKQSDDLPELCTVHHNDAKLLCIGFSWKTMGGRYRNVVLTPSAAEPGTVGHFLRGYDLYAHNTKYDILAARRFTGLKVYDTVGSTGDTLLDFYSFDIGSRGFSLDALSSRYLNSSDWKSVVWQYMDAAKKTRKPGWCTFADIPSEVLYEYNAKDGFHTARLYHEVLKLRPDFDRNSFITKFLMDLTETLIACEERGIAIDEEARKKITEQTKRREEETFQEIISHPACKAVAAGFSISKEHCFDVSPDKILDDGRYYFKPSRPNSKSSAFLTRLSIYMQHHTGQKSDGGLLSFEKDVLKAIAGLLPEIPNPSEGQKLFRLIRENRSLRDLNSKYLKTLPSYVVDGRIRYSFKLASTTTGRLSCASFNIQQIKKKSGLRRMFVASPGYKLVSMDYDRIELIVLAFLAQEPTMLEALWRKEDLHEVAASLLPGATRDMGKTANFLVVYGGGAQSFAAKAGVSLEVASKFMQMFNQKYSAIEDYYRKLDSIVYKGEHLETVYGRRRHFELTGDHWQDGELKRQWRNFTIQSTASDITAHSAVTIYKGIKGTKWEDINRILTLIHDDILFEIKEEYLVPMIKLNKAIMEDTNRIPGGFNAPLTTGISIGDNWEDMEPYELVGDELVKVAK